MLWKSDMQEYITRAYLKSSGSSNTLGGELDCWGSAWGYGSDPHIMRGSDKGTVCSLAERAICSNESELVADPSIWSLLISGLGGIIPAPDASSTIKPSLTLAKKPTSRLTKHIRRYWRTLFSLLRSPFLCTFCCWNQMSVHCHLTSEWLNHIHH